MTHTSYTEDASIDINPVNLNVQVASGLFVGLYDWNGNSEDKKAEAALLGRLRYSFYTW